MEHTYKFGKIDANGIGRLINEVEVEVELREVDRTSKEVNDDRKTALEFACSASVYNSSQTDLVMGGQCLDELMNHPSLSTNPLFCDIHEMWTKYHLNTLNAGTPRQTEALEQAIAEGKLENRNASNYVKCCDYLESVGLLYDEEYLVKDKNGNPTAYQYGHGWIVRDIPPEDLEICKAMASGEYEVQRAVKEIRNVLAKAVERD